MTVETPAPAHAVAHAAAPAGPHPGVQAHPDADTGWSVEQPADGELRAGEGRAERWATWVLIYLAALTTSLALGASAWALGLAR
jgi:hypothetical protein